MKILIIDHREKAARSRVVGQLLRDAGHSVTLAAQVGGPTATKRAAIQLAKRHDSVLLHSSAEQGNALWAMRHIDCYRNKRVLLFTGGAFLPEFREDAANNPLHICLPFPVPLDPDPDWCKTSGQEIILLLAGTPADITISATPVVAGHSNEELNRRLERLYFLLRHSELNDPKVLERIREERNLLLDSRG